MNRRTFLTRLAVVTASTFATNTLAQSHNMHGSSTGNSHSMPNAKRMMNAPVLLPATAQTTNQPLPALPILANQSQQPGEFVATLQARPTLLNWLPNQPTEFWCYNGQVPGPLIEVYEGDKVSITLKNDLPQATTVHWHGLPVPADQDGNPQDEIPPGQSRVYSFTLPEGCAGTYWYHPHGHNTVAEQVYRGLAGALIVRSKNDPLRHYPEQNWLISDLKLAANGQIADNTMMDWMNGREGQFVLINGAYQPTINLQQPTRVRVWNACSGRYLKLTINNVGIYLVGTDGGLIEQPQLVEHLLLSPGERAELLLLPSQAGETALLAMAYDRGKMGRVPAEQDLLLAHIQQERGRMTILPENLRKISDPGPITAYKTLEYTEVMSPGQGMQFLINGKSHDLQRIDLKSNLNTVEEWTIFNNSHMDHNFHLHGTQFLVLEHRINNQVLRPAFKALKDTVNLRPYETMTIKVQQTQRGLRMYHCHILEHETLGMMGQLQVI